MGRGIASEAKQKYPWLPNWAGAAITEFGLRVEVNWECKLILFPVKHNFWEIADVVLIRKCLEELLLKFKMTDFWDNPKYKDSRILCPRFGCGNGKLDWAEIKPMVAQYLKSERFVVFSK